MRFTVQMTREAEEDLLRLYDFVLERELNRVGGVDFETADQALNAIRNGFATLRSSPFTCRKADRDSFLRELIIPFGHLGYVGLFEIVDRALVVVAAVRHQRDDDYH